MANQSDITVEQFAALFQEASGMSARLLGLDLGTKTIGLAISDSKWSIASPVKTIRRTKFTADVAELLDLADREKVQGLVDRKSVV